MSILLNPKEKAEANIKHAVCWGIFLCFFSLLTVILNIEAVIKSKTPGDLVDEAERVILFLVLAATTFGIYKRSRLCALLFMGFFLIQAVGLSMFAVGGWGNPFAQFAFVIIGAVFCFRGIRGTFAYYKIKQAESSNTTGIVTGK